MIIFCFMNRLQRSLNQPKNFLFFVTIDFFNILYNYGSFFTKTIISANRCASILTIHQVLSGSYSSSNLFLFNITWWLERRLCFSNIIYSLYPDLFVMLVFLQWLQFSFLSRVCNVWSKWNFIIIISRVCQLSLLFQKTYIDSLIFLLLLLF